MKKSPLVILVVLLLSAIAVFSIPSVPQAKAQPTGWELTGAITQGGAYSCVQYHNYIYCVNGSYADYTLLQNGAANEGWNSTTVPPEGGDIGPQSCAAYSGYIYCWFVTLDTSYIYSAPISDTGIGSWTSGSAPSVTRGLVQRTPSCVISSSAYIYCTSSWSNTANGFISIVVSYATVSSGTIGSWTIGSNFTGSGSIYNPGDFYGSCVLSGSSIICPTNAAKSGLPITYPSITLTSVLSSNVPGSWSISTNPDYPLQGVEAGSEGIGEWDCVVYETYPTCIGGYSTGDVVSDVYYLSGGSWVASGNYSEVFANVGCATDNTVYITCVGGVNFEGETRDYVAYTSTSFPVVQPLQINLKSGSAEDSTFTLSGCSDIYPPTIIGDGIITDIAANSTCSMTVTAPSDTTSQITRFAPGDNTSITFTTCAINTCPTVVLDYYVLYNDTYTLASVGGNFVSNGSTTIYIQGDKIGGSANICSMSIPESGSKTESCAGFADSGSISYYAPTIYYYGSYQRWADAPPTSCSVLLETGCTVYAYEQWQSIFVANPTSPTKWDMSYDIQISGTALGQSDSTLCTIDAISQGGSAACETWSDTKQYATFPNTLFWVAESPNSFNITAEGEHIVDYEEPDIVQSVTTYVGINAPDPNHLAAAIGPEVIPLFFTALGMLIVYVFRLRGDFGVTVLLGLFFIGNLFGMLHNGNFTTVGAIPLAVTSESGIFFVMWLLAGGATSNG